VVGASAAGASDGDAAHIWSVAEACLLYDHSWVRLAAAQLIGCYMDARAPRQIATRTCTDYLGVGDKVFRLGQTFCEQLESTRLDSKLADQLMKNLFFVGRVLFLLHTSGPTPVPVGRAKKGSNSDAVAASGDGDGDDDSDGDEEAVVVQSSGLVWTLKQLSYLARREATTTPEATARRDCIFKVFAALVQFMATSEAVLPHLKTLVEPLYRTEDSEESPDSIKDLGTQTQKLIEEVVGQAEFSAAFNKARVKVAVQRAHRKQGVQKLAVLNPQKAAERKINKNLKKKDYRKRKIQKIREGQGRSAKSARN
jgi:U3 small nucleolar RNA-associated protein 20